MSKEMRKDIEKDGISTFYIKLERLRSECYDSITTYSVEIPSKLQNTIEIMEPNKMRLEIL